MKYCQLIKVIWLLVFIIVTESCNNKVKEPLVNKSAEKSEKSEKPNIILIYLDDLGYGDLTGYGATELPTPNIDKLINGGIKFTNGYASSATCTPSRYALLTGTYPWRNKKAKILPGTAPLIIDTTQVTLPRMLKNQGYYTGIVGKWHLGLGNGFVDWNQKISPGPNEIGFDYSFIMAATQDRVPTVYIEDNYVVNLESSDPIEISYEHNFEGEPTGLNNPELLVMNWDHGHNNSIVNGIPRIGFMKGGKSAKWSDIDMADKFLSKAQDFVKEHKNKPFFLYYAMQQPHVPRTPHPRFVSSTDMGPRGDVIVEADWCIGEFLKTLDAEGLLDNTLIIFSSDNGPVLQDGYKDDAQERIGNHKPNGGLRGGKYSLFEAGTRVPFVTYWKGKIQPKVSDAIICQIDLLASLADLVGEQVENKDSENLMPILLGESTEGRKGLVIEAGGRTAYRDGDWIYIPAYEGQSILKDVEIESGSFPEPRNMLFNLSNDPKQQINLTDSFPDTLKELKKRHDQIRGFSK